MDHSDSWYEVRAMEHFGLAVFAATEYHQEQIQNRLNRLARERTGMNRYDENPQKDHGVAPVEFTRMDLHAFIINLSEQAGVQYRLDPDSGTLYYGDLDHKYGGSIYTA